MAGEDRAIRITIRRELPVKTLRQWRRLRAWSQKKLADESGHSVSTVSAIERGKTPISLAVIRDLSRALGVGLSQVREFAQEVDGAR